MPEVKDIDLKTISLEKSNLEILNEDVNNTLEMILQKNMKDSHQSKKKGQLSKVI